MCRAPMPSRPSGPTSISEDSMCALVCRAAAVSWPSTRTRVWWIRLSRNSKGARFATWPPGGRSCMLRATSRAWEGSRETASLPLIRPRRRHILESECRGWLLRICRDLQFHGVLGRVFRDRRGPGAQRSRGGGCHNGRPVGLESRPERFRNEDPRRWLHGIRGRHLPAKARTYFAAMDATTGSRVRDLS